MSHTVCAASGTRVRQVCVNVAEPSGRAVYGRLFSGNANSNPAGGRYICLLSVLCVCACVLPAGYLCNRPITRPEEFY